MTIGDIQWFLVGVGLAFWGGGALYAIFSGKSYRVYPAKPEE